MGASWLTSLASYAARPYAQHSWLSWAELALLVPSLVGLYAVMSAARTLRARNARLRSLPSKKSWIATSPRPATRFRIFTSAYAFLRPRFATLFQRLKSRSGQVASSAATPVTFAFVIGGLLVYIGMGIRDYPVYEYHNVRVEEQVAPNTWWMRKDDGRFLYSGCPDFPNERVIWAGYIAQKVRWQEFGNCKSILRSDLGFWWQRDARGNAKEIR